METALKGLEKAIATGKIQARHPQVNDLYDLALRDTPEGVRLFWKMKEARQSWRESREGAYLLRTNLQAETAEELWSKYMQLTEAEASFRALKSELSIPSTGAARQGSRDGGLPVLRSLGNTETSPETPPDYRSEAIGKRRDNAQPLSPMQALALLSTVQSADIVLPTTTVMRFGSAALPNPPANRNRSFTNWASASPAIFSSTANVVQTRPAPKPVFNHLAFVNK